MVHDLTHAHILTCACTQVQGQPQARQLEYADLTALPYFNAVLKESMRLHTVAATGVFKCVIPCLILAVLLLLASIQVCITSFAGTHKPHTYTHIHTRTHSHTHIHSFQYHRKVAVPSVELGGYSIPKGSAVWLPFYAMHNSTYNFVNPKVRADCGHINQSVLAVKALLV